MLRWSHVCHQSSSKLPWQFPNARVFPDSRFDWVLNKQTRTALAFEGAPLASLSGPTRGKILEEVVREIDARPPAAAVGGVPWGPLLYPEGAHGAPYFYPAGDPGPPTFTQKAPGPLTVGFPPGKKISQLCCENFFPLHGRVLAIVFLHFFKSPNF